MPPCADDYCSDKMQSIAAEFAAAKAPVRSELPHVSSGECYHRSDGYDPEQRHFGVVLLDEKNGDVYLGGNFGFFYAENPYAAWSVQDARGRIPRLYSKNHRIEFGADFAFADLNPSGKQEDQMRYWLRQDGSRIYVYGAWGYTHVLLCRLQKHAR